MTHAEHRALDRRVAEAMGCRVEERVLSPDDLGGRAVLLCNCGKLGHSYPYWTDRTEPLRIVFSFSTVISAAWPLMTRLADLGCPEDPTAVLTLQLEQDGKTWVGFTCDEMSYGPSASADTAPEAICLAFISAVETQKQKVSHDDAPLA